MAEVESRLGIEPLEELLEQRAEKVRKVVHLRALYGSFGTFDYVRKNELSRIAGLLRAQAVRDNVPKKTEAQLDQEAHAHAEYVALITKATTERAEWAQLESDIEAIEHRIRRGNVITQYLSSEARL